MVGSRCYAIGMTGNGDGVEGWKQAGAWSHTRGEDCEIGCATATVNPVLVYPQNPGSVRKKQVIL